MRIKLAIMFLMLVIAGCGGSKPVIPDTSDSRSAVPSSSQDTSGLDDPSIRSGGSFGDSDFATDTADSLIIYFGYDQSEVKPEYTDLLAAHARRLANQPTARLRLEGHADERGSREYNIGLGERRAQAVRRLLLIQGASAAQISTVSFGEERPAAYGSTESDYAKNRRVELSYLN
jgi:peptidoglycan-associated lipoprotein